MTDFAAYEYVQKFPKTEMQSVASFYVVHARARALLYNDFLYIVVYIYSRS